MQIELVVVEQVSTGFNIIVLFRGLKGSKEHKASLKAHAVLGTKGIIEESFIQANGTANKLIVGVRNPNDFIHMLRYDSQNIVIFINSHQQHTGSLALFEEGLDIILQYIHFKNKIEQSIPFIEIAEHQLNDNNLIHSLLKVLAFHAP